MTSDSASSQDNEQQFEYEGRLKRWGAIKDALGLTPAEEKIEGLELVTVDEVAIGGVNGVTVAFHSKHAVEKAQTRLKEAEDMSKYQDCFSQAQDIQSYRLDLMSWHNHNSYFGDNDDE